ncbi:DUF5642 family protein [Mycolicibacterium elephantis]|uniref:DUF5642 domain-containing protein n=2 Tax=Mycolicibacterium elephantis TaxID=81858 RepID=A0A439DVS1_9MYCO|nr:DUF5642 family protein [Mycolicibacterium elephantis]KKW62914.1 hypothetical protein AAV95_19945 [Mycolicibacterium elephantis]MCV7222913.1 DUF5642 family protein [Mycolicibacterium elephantis]OBB28253.1 hypothetical protein A5762_06430 [Mycolicibacterium elephantis]OBE98321.1 hypothetical protein A5776_15010 [Mycolicibacterium elephantis]ORA69240.1 hypothetical protein BST23_00865 [Mycolicibacterium elephantis]
MLNRAAVAIACVGALAACTTDAPDLSNADIARVKEVRASFGPEFKVTDVGPSGIDPRLLGPQALPPGMKFEPADCAAFANQQMVPAGAKGNMAATTAEGEGNRFIAIALETSEAAAVNGPSENCRKVGFVGPGVRGLVETTEVPRIEGVQTVGTRRVLQTTVGGNTRTGELYNYVASFGSFLVIVTANPLVLPDQPVAPVDTQRARDLLAAAVAAVRG